MTAFQPLGVKIDRGLGDTVRRAVHEHAQPLEALQISSTRALTASGSRIVIARS